MIGNRRTCSYQHDFCDRSCIYSLCSCKDRPAKDVRDLRQTRSRLYREEETNHFYHIYKSRRTQACASRGSSYFIEVVRPRGVLRQIAGVFFNYFSIFLDYEATARFVMCIKYLVNWSNWQSAFNILSAFSESYRLQFVN